MKCVLGRVGRYGQEIVAFGVPILYALVAHMESKEGCRLTEKFSDGVDSPYSHRGLVRGHAVKCRSSDSNRKPTAYKAVALPLSY